jgi:peptidoglycan/LPS O-acetylase OafA/YrhL
MQFYVLLPALIIVMKRVHPLLVALAAAAISAVSPLLLGDYLVPGLVAHFGLPSALPYRLNAFIGGMMVAEVLKNRTSKTRRIDDAVAIVCAAACMLPLHKLVITLFLVFVLISLDRLPVLTWIFSARPMRFLGEISYSFYLCHLLIVIPVTYFLVFKTPLMSLPYLERLALAVGITFLPVVGVSYCLYRFVEVPSMGAGRMLAGRLRPSQVMVSAPI